MKRLYAAATSVMLLIGASTAFAGQARSSRPRNPQPAPAAAPVPAGTTAAASVLPDYKIGVGDVLTLTFWREQDLSGDAVVRPDGKITVPLIKDMVAAGLTPAQLQTELETAAKRFIQEPNVTVSVRTINSRQVFIQGNVARPMSYPLRGPTTVLQFLAEAGGVLEFADKEKILIMRTENGKTTSFKFNYNDMKKLKNLSQNIELRPGDVVIVP